VVVPLAQNEMIVIVPKNNFVLFNLFYILLNLIFTISYQYLEIPPLPPHGTGL